MNSTVISFFMFAITAIPNMRADIIVFSNGTTSQVYNIDLSPKWIYYTETPYENAELKRISIDNVFAYKIGDGQLISIEKSIPSTAQEEKTPHTSAQPHFIAPVVAADNQELIDLYNNHPDLVCLNKNPQPNKYTRDFLSLWGIENNSILSDKNIEIGFEKVYLNDKYNCVTGNLIRIRNKTSQPIYIDLASTFRIMNDGYAISYFTNSVYNEGGGESKDSSLNLGAISGALGIGGAIGTLTSGINIGKINSQTSSISKTEQQILIIPPLSAVTLPGIKVSNGKKILECYEPFYFRNYTYPDWRQSDALKYEQLEDLTIIEDMRLQKSTDNKSASKESLDIHPWIQTNYSSQGSPKKIGRLITYSTSPDFNTYTTLPVNIYIRGIFGIKKTDGAFNTHYNYFNDKSYKCITNKDYFLVGSGIVKN